jgi:hydrogenase-4 membrane subunit HyfE
MTALQRTNFNYIVLVSSIFTMLLGGVVLCGWVFNIPSLTRINPGWNTMVPSTALCFMLSGLALLTSKTPRMDQLQLRTELLSG